VSRQKPDAGIADVIPQPPMVSKWRAIALVSARPVLLQIHQVTSVFEYLIALTQRSKPASMSLSSAWSAVHDHRGGVISAAASQVSCRILLDGMRTRLFADATLIRYGAWM